MDYQLTIVKRNAAQPRQGRHLYRSNVLIDIKLRQERHCYSHSQLGTVIRYIQNQEQHHAKKTFREEYLALLDKFEVPHEERYIFASVESD